MLSASPLTLFMFLKTPNGHLYHLCQQHGMHLQLQVWWMEFVESVPWEVELPVVVLAQQLMLISSIWVLNAG